MTYHPPVAAPHWLWILSMLGALSGIATFSLLFLLLGMGGTYSPQRDLLNLRWIGILSVGQALLGFIASALVLFRYNAGGHRYRYQIYIALAGLSGLILNGLVLFICVSLYLSELI